MRAHFAEFNQTEEFERRGKVFEASGGTKSEALPGAGTEGAKEEAEEGEVREVTQGSQGD